MMTLPRTPAAVVFDMDGLLFDTEALRQEALLLAAAEGGHEMVLEFSNRVIGLPWTQVPSRPRHPTLQSTIT
jgi:beta-phosphoglucomutase-like phosphatase (HAD superfamily)